MLFKPNTLIYVQRSGVIVYGKHLPTARLDFPVNLVKNLEVLQGTQLLDKYRQFFMDNAINGKRLIMVLDTSIVFEKVIELDKSGKPDMLMQAFIDAMPFEPGKRACAALQTDKQLCMFATNADLYMIIADALKAAGAGKLVASTPSPAYHLTSEQRTLSTAAERFFNDTEVRSVTDFRSVVPV